jgi:hypothetical protein
MEERISGTGPSERPAERPPGAGSDGPAAGGLGPPHLGDPRALTILTTEHWSLLTARALVYNEAFARAGMFLTFLTGSLVALGFVSQASGFSQEFLIVATALLGADVLIGITTIGRISYASDEEFRALQGMNRLRHAYLEMVPSLEPYISTSRYDDFESIVEIYGPPLQTVSLGNSVFHGLTTAPGLVSMITALAAGAFAATLSLTLGAAPAVAIVAAFATIVLLLILMTWFALRVMATAGDAYEVRFPRPARRKAGD